MLAPEAHTRQSGQGKARPNVTQLQQSVISTVLPYMLTVGLPPLTRVTFQKVAAIFGFAPGAHKRKANGLTPGLSEGSPKSEG